MFEYDQGYMDARDEAKDELEERLVEHRREVIEEIVEYLISIQHISTAELVRKLKDK